MILFSTLRVVFDTKYGTFSGYYWKVKSKNSIVVFKKYKIKLVKTDILNSELVLTKI